MWIRSRLVRCTAVLTGAFVITVYGADANQTSGGNTPVDESALVPLLSPTFTNWICVSTGRGPRCSGERLTEIAWEPLDFPCVDPVYHMFHEYRTQTRNYGTDYLLYDRWFHQEQIESFSLSASGKDYVTISARGDFHEVMAIPGDDSNFSINSLGVLFTLKARNGGVVYQWAGNLLEGDSGAYIESFNGNATSPNSLFAQDDPDAAIVGGVCEALGSSPL